MPQLPAILVRFLEYELRPDQIQSFKTLINSVVEGQIQEFHNHTGEGEQTLLGYPSIQYRSIKTEMIHESGYRKFFYLAGLFAVGKGVGVVMNFLEFVRANNAPRILLEFDIEDYSVELNLLNQPKKYKINHWLPLNVSYRADNHEKIDNFKIWTSNLSMVQRVQFLEGILMGQIIDFCYAMGHQIPENQLKVTILDYHQLGAKNFTNNDKKGIHFEAFDVIYEANISLPDYIGLGKGKSKGFGWQTQTPFHWLKR